VTQGKLETPMGMNTLHPSPMYFDDLFEHKQMFFFSKSTHFVVSHIHFSHLPISTVRQPGSRICQSGIKGTSQVQVGGTRAIQLQGFFLDSW
jgi:hypothetical protein